GGVNELLGALRDGPRPADEALLQVTALVSGESDRLGARAVLLAMLGRFDEAWPIAWAKHERMLELRGWPLAHWLAKIAILEGRHELAVQYLRDYCTFLEERREYGFLSSIAPMLARELCPLGRYDEAQPLAERGRELEAQEDVATKMLWRQARALVLANRGEYVEAECLAREAAAIAEGTDALNEQGETLLDLAEVLRAAGRTEEAAEALEQ